MTGFNAQVMCQIACPVINSIMVAHYFFLFNFAALNSNFSFSAYVVHVVSTKFHFCFTTMSSNWFFCLRRSADWVRKTLRIFSKYILPCLLIHPSEKLDEIKSNNKAVYNDNNDNNPMVLKLFLFLCLALRKEGAGFAGRLLVCPHFDD